MRRRRRKNRKIGRGTRGRGARGRGARSEKFTEVNIVRRGKGTGKLAKVTIVRRRNGDITVETYEL